MTTVVSNNEAFLPERRKEQADDLMCLAGDALMRGDRIAWQVLYMASRQLEGMPEYDSREGMDISSAIDRYARGDAR